MVEKDGASHEPPEVPLPDSPNALVFAMGAAARLEGRTWASLVRDAVEATRAFHATSGLTTSAGWSCRVSLDRKNHRLHQLLLWVVIEGRCTAADLGALEREVRARFPESGDGSIERLPPNLAHAVLWRGGVASFPWFPAGRRPEPWCVVLTLAEGGVRPVAVARGRATADLVPPELPTVIGVIPPPTAEEQEVARLRVAFAMHFTDAVVAADGVVQERESAFVANLYPPDFVSAIGLDDPAVRAACRREAATRLRDCLGHHDKLALLGLLFSACFSDGTLDAREIRVIKDAGEELGLTKREVVDYLRRLW